MDFDFIKTAGLIVTIVGLVVGWFLLWLTKREKAIEKSINDKRDFNHLLGNQKQISEGISTGFDDIEEQIKHLRELMLRIESYLIRNQGTNHRE
ncbi:hypothetical protein [Nostoc sp.]|uniref:hypothetical protein n=1 Tax=Nostoc sp. TaxID=1180 RepID=UPI002FF52776